MKHLPAVAVIPAYNEERNLGELLDQVLADDYDDVYVLDDASTDHTVELARSYGADVNVIAGSENLGSAGNRNRIIPLLSRKAILHFLDADVNLNSSHNPDLVREAIADETIGLVGGLIRHHGGIQMPYNYGPRFSLPQMVSSWLYGPIYNLETRSPDLGRKVRRIADNSWPLMAQWPDPLKVPTARDVYWCAEANTVIRSDVFAATGGYNASLRYHEILDYSVRLDRFGLRRRFDPNIDVTHRGGPNTTNNSNTIDFWIALARLTGRAGLKEFITGR
jgi:GT2 family glycosyltransferase